MIYLVPVSEAQLALRYDGEESLVEQAVAAATTALMEYMSEKGEFTDTAGELIADTNGDALYVPESVRRACIALAGVFLRDPTGLAREDFADGFMPPAVRALLNPYRVPVVG